MKKSSLVANYNKTVNIITFQSAINHGAVLQAYALKKQIEELGFDVKILDYRPSFMAKKYLSFQNNVLAFIKKIIQNFIFKIFIKKFLSLSKYKYRKYADFLKLPVQVSYLICGSDQIWNINIVKDVDPGYFLTFPVEHSKKIAYAASMGNTEIPKSLERKFIDALKTFDCISVREQFCKEQILKNGIEKPVSIVLDPTLLPIDYSEIVPKDRKKREYIAVYFVIRDDELEKAAFKLKHVLDIPLINISTYRYRGADQNKYFLSPGKWLRMIRDATIVCTNSFHATAFSIIFRKKFFTIRLHGKDEGLNNRMLELLSSLNLSNRLIDSNLQIPETKEQVLVSPNFCSAMELLKKKQEFSLSFLKNALHLQ